MVYCSLFLFSWSQQGSWEGWQRGRGSFGVKSFPLICTQSVQPSPCSQRGRRRGAVIDSWEKAGLGDVSPLWSTHGEEGSSFSSLWVVLGLFSRAFCWDAREKARGDFCFFFFLKHSFYYKCIVCLEVKKVGKYIEFRMKLFSNPMS